MEQNNKEQQEQNFPKPEEAFKNQKETKWQNKQRTLVVSSRGISQRQRHLMLDLVSLMPHSKKEVKLEKKDVPSQINELCYLHSCCNFMYFETRKRTDLYLWIGRFPNGPSVKFLVENIHTSEELKLSGNCLKGSRPILSFDGSFKQSMNLKLMRELLVHSFNVPRYHPRSKPTVDHVYSFSYCDQKIWFRNYQVAYEDMAKSLTDEQLYEIGPRFVLNPICILDGAMTGNVLYKNPEYLSRTKISAQKKREKKMQQLLKEKKLTKSEQTKNIELEHDAADDLFEVNDTLDAQERKLKQKNQKQIDEEEEQQEDEDDDEQEFDEEEDDEESLLNEEQ